MSQTQKKKTTELLPSSLLTDKQNAAIDFLYEHDHSLLMLPVGFGKTVLSLTAIQELLQARVFKRALVIAPLRVVQLTWATEPSKWEHLQDLNIALAIGTPAERIAAIESDAGVVVINFENVVWFFNKYGKKHGFDALCIDELTKLKATGGAGFKNLRHRAKDFSWRTGMTGTLVEEGLEFLYAQCLLIDEGKALGRNKEHFLETYFTPIDYNRYKWKPKQDSMALMSELITPFTFTVDSTDYDESLPTLVTDYLYVDLPNPARQVYDEMRKTLAADIDDDTVLAANSAVMTGKLQQIANGFMYRDDDVYDIHTAKLEALDRELYRYNGQVAIVYTFEWELDQILADYPDAGVLGRGVTRAKAQEIEKEWNAGRLNTLLLHPKSAGHGINLQHSNAHRIIFFSPIWSRDQTDQVIGRFRRRGNTAGEMYATFICAKKTIDDEVIVPRVLGKGDSARVFGEHLRGV